MSNILIVLLLSYAFGALVTFLVTILFSTVVKALILSFIVGFIYCLFALGFYVRTLKETSFIINAQNKDPQKGLGWYQERIIEQAQDMRFILKINNRDYKILSPQGLYKVFERDIRVKISPYDIEINCSRLMMRIILDYLALTQTKHD